VVKEKHGVTPATRVLKENRVPFAEHPYRYEDKGGTETAAKALGVDEHAVIKTLVMEDEAKNPLVVLMHGDRQVSTKALARQLGVKQISPCDPAAVSRLTGYQVGGVSPFGTKRKLPVYVESTILELPAVYINGGKRGFLVQMSSAELTRCLSPTPVQASQ